MSEQSTEPAADWTAPFHRFIELKKQKTALKVKRDRLTSEIEELAESLPDILLEHGIDSINLDGYTLFSKDTAFAKAKEGDYRALSAVLEAKGFKSLCQIGSRALNTLWNGFQAEDGEVPEWLQAVAEKDSKIRLASKKAPKK